jgi:mannose-1-phosphate guanylyltransferase
MRKSSPLIVPVILSGGSGTRLWPMSVADRPKQFLALTGDRTMFELTLDRVADPERFAAPLIVANARHADLIGVQLANAGVSGATLLLEPCARNTAPAIALAAHRAGDAVMLIMPSDHVIADSLAFQAAIDRALPLANQGWLVTFGIAPDGPETGYGYIRGGESIAPGAHQVDRFVEKPSLDKAEAMLTEGGHFWNGGIFLFRADRFLEALSAHAPDMAMAVERAVAAGEASGDRFLPDMRCFEACPSDSVDYAVMEKADKVAVVPVAMGWSDLGSWDALHDIGEKDEAGNRLTPGTRIEGGSNNLVHAQGIRVSMAGVSDLIVVATADEILILPRGGSQAAKQFAG